MGVGASAVAGILALPSVVLPWVWTSLELPLVFVGLVIPLLQGGRLLGPLLLLPWVAGLSRRKWLITLSAGIMALALLALGLLLWSGASSVAVIPALLGLALLAGVARGGARFGYKEVLARTLRREERGSLLSRATSVGGWIALGAALLFHVISGTYGKDETEFLHILVGAGLWLAGGACFALLFEPSSGVTKSTRTRSAELFRRGVRALRTNESLRRYTILRMLLLSLDLAYPFYTVHAVAVHGTEGGISLSLIVVFTSLASILQGPVWGKRLDRSAQHSLVLAAFLASFAGILLLGVEAFTWMEFPVLHGIGLLLVSIAVQGGLNARNLYLVQIADEEDRPVITAFTTTLSGIFGLVLATVLGSLAHYQDIMYVIVALVLMQIGVGLYAGSRGSAPVPVGVPEEGA